MDHTGLDCPTKKQTPKPALDYEDLRTPRFLRGGGAQLIVICGFGRIDTHSTSRD
jgi:hypothetical protein